jgi:predicted dehydrogenase
MKHGIIGCGFIAQKHVEAIKEFGGEVFGSYDVIWKRAIYGKAFETPEELIQESDVIHICAPNVFHIPYLNMCKDKKVIVEKPIGVDTQQTQYILNNNAAVCFQRRFNNQCQQIKKMCERKGQPTKILANIFVQRDPAYWESWRGDKDYSGGGALMNIGIHYLDLMQWWTGEKGKVISAQIGMFDRSIDEGGSAELKFGETEARILISSRFHKREIEMIIMWDDEVIIYDTDDATHLDVLKAYLQYGIKVSPVEAINSLRLAEEIYAKDNRYNPLNPTRGA